MLITDIISTVRQAVTGRIQNFENLRKLMEVSSTFIPNHRVGIQREVINIHHIKAELQQPSSAQKQIILYLHGGAYFAGSYRTHRAIVSEICHFTKMHAIVPNYRLTPKHPYPAALEDVVSVYQYLLSQSYLSEDIFVAGDSAGSGLTLALFQYLKAHNLPLPKAGILICPWVDLKNTAASIQSNTKDPLLDYKILNASAKLYAGDEALDHPYISPLYGDLSDLPPIFIQAGTHDPLYDDATRLHQKIKEQGGEVSIEIYEGMPHVWHAYSLFIKDGRKALKSIAEFINKEV